MYLSFVIPSKEGIQHVSSFFSYQEDQLKQGLQKLLEKIWKKFKKNFVKILEDLTLSELKSFHKSFDKKTLEILKPQFAVEGKDSYGGTSLKKVRESIQKAKKILKQQ